MVITRGDSPGKAASKAIDQLELPTNRASIIMIPVSKEGKFEQYQDQLLNEHKAADILEKMGVEGIRGISS